MDVLAVSKIFSLSFLKVSVLSNNEPIYLAIFAKGIRLPLMICVLKQAFAFSGKKNHFSFFVDLLPNHFCAHIAVMLSALRITSLSVLGNVPLIAMAKSSA